MNSRSSLKVTFICIVISFLFITINVSPGLGGNDPSLRMLRSADGSLAKSVFDKEISHGIDQIALVPLENSNQWEHIHETTLYTDIYNANYLYNVHIQDIDGIGDPELVLVGALTDYSWISTPNPRCNWCNQWQLDAYTWDGSGPLAHKYSETLDVGYDTTVYSTIGTIGGTTKIAGVGNLYPCGSGEPHGGMALFDNALQNEHYDWGNRQADPCHHDFSVFTSVDIADVDGDGTEEIIAGGSGDSTGGKDAYREWLLAIRTSDGSAFGEELYHHIDHGSGYELITDLVIADVDGDSTQEVIITGYSRNTGVPRTWLRILTWDGTSLQTEHATSFNIGSEDYLHRLAVGNVNGTEKPEIILAGRVKTGSTLDWYVKALRWDGSTLTEVANQSWNFGADANIQAVKIIDLDADGKNEILLGGNIVQAPVPGATGGYGYVHYYADWHLKVLTLSGITWAEEFSKQWDSSRDYDTNNNDVPDSGDEGTIGRLYDMDVGDLDGDGKNEIALVGEWIWVGWHVKIIDMPDLVPFGLEITQAIQSITNTVTLVEEKPAYARFHVKTDGPELDNVSALLSATRDGQSLGEAIIPNNPNAVIKVISNPARAGLNDSFYFQIPPEWLSGTVEFTAEVNPSHTITEDDYQNNSFSNTVTFEPTPALTVTVVGVIYAQNNITYTAEITDYLNMASWLRSAYPVRRLNMITQTLTITSGLPTASTLNATLATMYTLNSGNTDQCPATRYYGMVSDGGGFMRGLAAGIPGCIASGPTGDDYWDWDIDGSYGDWYGAHELGHSLGRYHAEFCGAGGGVPYPYPNGLIGGPSTNPVQFYGFNIETLDIYTPTLWMDVMSYCDNLWISDFTYEGIRDRLVTEGVHKQSNPSPTQSSAEGYLLILGELNLTQTTAQLDSIYRLSNLTPSTRPATSEYSLQLLGVGDSILAEYPFTPKEDTEPQAGEDLMAMIYEIVPYVAGTARVIVLHQETELASQTVSANAPEVTVIYPNGGEVLNGQIVASWIGSDIDGDPLTYALQYSADNGGTWTTLAARIKATHYAIQIGELAGSDQGRIRVLVSDGINTATDISNGPFSVSFKKPMVRIISPATNNTYLDEQTFTLVGEAYDREDGYVNDSQLIWQSNIDGNLGIGRNLTVTALSEGEHLITLTATDSDAMNATANITLQITRQPRIYLPLILK